MRQTFVTLFVVLALAGIVTSQSLLLKEVTKRAVVLQEATVADSSTTPTETSTVASDPNASASGSADSSSQTTVTPAPTQSSTE